MGFLAPWFVVAGIAAISLPVLFHLFRRTPRGRTTFSTLMFLTPSPPRLTSRSRIENWPLLFLRALILTLLAFVFGRPFLRQWLERPLDAPAGQRLVVLIDRSASMRRADLWPRAIAESEKLIDAAGPHDELAVMSFDSQTTALVPFDVWRAAPVNERAGLARAALAKLQPSWSATHLYDALQSAVDAIDTAGKHDASAAVERPQRIALVSDLQAGSRITGLQGFEWPERVTVELVSVKTDRSNAGVHALAMREDQASDDKAAAKERLRVLLTNAADSTRETFKLAWSEKSLPLTADPAPTKAEEGKTPAKNDKSEPLVNSPVDVYATPGQTRVVRAPALPGGETAELVLSGDDEPFDNRYWFVTPPREQLRVLHLSNEKADDPRSLRYFLERALGQSATGRNVAVEAVDPHAVETRAPTATDLENVPLVVLATDRDLPAPWMASLNEWMERGGVVLAVVADAKQVAWRGLLPVELADAKHVTVSAGDTSREYVLLSEFDRRHPLFAPFADPRYSDFTKIRFWKHQKLALDETAAKTLRVLAKFDSGAPAMVEAPRGDGRLLLLATGWQPQSSQLGVSSKFVPLVSTLVELGWRRPPPAASYEAGAIVDLARMSEREERTEADRIDRMKQDKEEDKDKKEEEDKSEANDKKEEIVVSEITTVPTKAWRVVGPWTVRTPAGREVTVPVDAPKFELADGPGVYEVRSSSGLQRLAVNLSPDESKTAPLGQEPLEALGIRWTTASEKATAETMAHQQALQVRELESRQQGWRWFLLAALGVTLFETVYSGYVAGREKVAQSS